jgi:threonine aldolase
VFFDPSPLGFTDADVHARLLALENPISGGMGPRVVIHHQINPEAVEEFISVVHDMKKEKGVHVEEGDPWEEEGKLRKNIALGY